MNGKEPGKFERFAADRISESVGAVDVTAEPKGQRVLRVSRLPISLRTLFKEKGSRRQIP